MTAAGDPPGFFAPRRVDKPWGNELIWALTDRYCGKVITIEFGPAPVAPVPRAEG